MDHRTTTGPMNLRDAEAKRSSCCKKILTHVIQPICRIQVTRLLRYRFVLSHIGIVPRFENTMSLKLLFNNVPNTMTNGGCNKQVCLCKADSDEVDSYLYRDTVDDVEDSEKVKKEIAKPIISPLRVKTNG